jgi:membrane-associated phospholipid phosphatase
VKKALLGLSFVFFLFSSFGQEASEKPSAPESELSMDGAWNDMVDSFRLLFEGSYQQFTTVNNLYHAAWGIPLNWYAFEEDKRLQKRYGGTEIINVVDHVGDLGVIFNFPVLHSAFYIYGKRTGNNHHVQFAKEYFAAMYLALVETGILSYVQVHHRPQPQDASFWEKEFRGDSSWPSGHVIPYMTLFFKTLQFYGPAWSAIPAVLTIMSSMQRVQDDKHWVSDITGSLLLSAWASEGVRKAAGYDKNHPFYKWVFEHNAQVGFLRYRGALGPRVSWSF